MPWGILGTGRVSAILILVGSSSPARAIVPFTEEAIQRGLVYQMQPYPQQQGYSGFGCGFADLDGDGDEDVVLMGAADGHMGIFENDGSGSFTDRSIFSGIPLLPEASSFSSADYDGDGDLDLYLTQILAGNLLMRNDGNFHFTNMTAQAGVGDTGVGKAPIFGDYDNDGWLDLYVCNYTAYPPDPGTPNRLYHNLGNGTFQEVGAAQTVDSTGYSFQAVWFDYDRDGDVDLYLSNDRGHQGPLLQGNQLWRNDDGQLVEVSEGCGADMGLFSMGLACGDFDANRWPDLYVTNLDSLFDTPREDVLCQQGFEFGYNPLFVNQGDGTFIEACGSAGVANCESSWGSIFLDFDNNGHLDLYVNNQFEDNSLYSCNGTFPCTEIAAAANARANSGVGCPFPPCNASYTSAMADVDDDGDLDLLVNNLNINVELLINHEGQTRNWIRYQMVGQGANRYAVGGNTDTRVGSAWRFHEIFAGGNSYTGLNELTMHVGLDAATQADEVVAQWPGGQTVRTLINLPANHTWTLYPPERLGDTDGNLSVTIEDFVAFADCFVEPEFLPGCEMMDFDGDSDVDNADFAAFLATFDGIVEDCDRSGTADMQQLIQNPAQDHNNNGALDACECPQDLDGSGEVNASDLAQLLAAWGSNPGHPADFDGSGQVNAADLAQLLAGWGPC